MTVLNIATTEIEDEEQMKAYIAAAAPLMKRFGAEVVVRGRYLTTLLGDARAPHIVGIFRFANMDIAKSFYSSEEYINIIPLREAAGRMTFDFYEE